MVSAFMDVLMGKCVVSIGKQHSGTNIFYSYSKNIIWLELSSTNNDPNVILLFYLISILRNDGKLVNSQLHYY